MIGANNILETVREMKSIFTYAANSKSFLMKKTYTTVMKWLQAS